jgi:sorbitol-specific phosphotransferase system component IIC
MNDLVFWLVVIGASALGFGAWGRFSKAGKIRFDEMAGIIPTLAYYLGMVLLAIALLIGIILYFTRK